MSTYINKTSKIRTFLSVFLVLIFVQVFLSLVFDIVKVDSREVAVVTNRGQVSQVLGAGWHFKMPYFTKESAVYDISVQNLTVNASSASKDQQVVDLRVNLQYQLESNKIKEIFLAIGGSGNGGNFRDERVQNIIQPMLQESVKATSAQYSAVDLLAKREDVKNAIIKNLEEKLSKYYINVLAINVENIDFSLQFNQAIENKVVAQQKAEQSRFELEVEKANLEKEKVKAEGLEIRGKALQQNPQILEEKKIEKWDGKLPQVQGQDGIIIDLQK
jgi:regulator of protease activity HflC (stomatin/prohibitin superfamily)